MKKRALFDAGVIANQKIASAISDLENTLTRARDHHSAVGQAFKERSVAEFGTVAFGKLGAAIGAVQAFDEQISAAKVGAMVHKVGASMSDLENAFSRSPNFGNIEAKSTPVPPPTFPRMPTWEETAEGMELKKQSSALQEMLETQQRQIEVLQEGNEALKDELVSLKPTVWNRVTEYGTRLVTVLTFAFLVHSTYGENLKAAWEAALAFIR